jgi:hypothetical protein
MFASTDLERVTCLGPRFAQGIEENCISPDQEVHPLKRTSKTKEEDEALRIGKFDILAGYIYVKERLAGQSEDEAKQRGMVVAILGARSRLGQRTHREEDAQKLKESAEKKKKTTITPDLFDKQVREKLGGFFDRVFLPALEAFVEAGLSYDEVKRALRISPSWGAKISGEQFRERAQQAARGRLKLRASANNKAQLS